MLWNIKLEIFYRRTKSGALDSPALKFSIGQCLNLIGENLIKYSTTEERPFQQKMALYCCHDTTVGPLLMAMGCFENEWPSFTADVAIELYEDLESKHWVRVLYCGKVSYYYLQV